MELRPEGMALVDLAGTQREISLMVLDGEASVGDWVLVHVGYAIEKVDEDEAQRSLELFRDLDMLDGELPSAPGENSPA